MTVLMLRLVMTTGVPSCPCRGPLPLHTSRLHLFARCVTPESTQKGSPRPTSGRGLPRVHVSPPAAPAATRPPATPAAAPPRRRGARAAGRSPHPPTPHPSSPAPPPTTPAADPPGAPPASDTRPATSPPR